MSDQIEIDLDKIERAAAAATPGPWIGAGPSFGEALPKYLNEVLIDRPCDKDDCYAVCHSPIGLDAEASADMAHIAESNPAVVLELVRRLREAEKDAARLDWLQKRMHDSSYAVQFRMLRDPAINAGMNRYECATGVGSGVWQRKVEGHSLRAAIDNATGEPK